MPPKRKARAVSYDDEDDFDVLAQSAPPPPKKRGKQKALAVDEAGNPLPEPEKRLARYRATCPKSLIDRVERALEQRFYLIERERDVAAMSESFKVLGSTGNCYEITVSHKVGCTCPDGQKGNTCKHVIFVMLRVLGVPQTSQHWFQKALLTSELQDLFASAKPVPEHLMNNRLTHQYMKENGMIPEGAQEEEEVQSGPNGKQRIPGDDDSCPVCYEDFAPGQTNGLVFCREGCGGAIHSPCFEQWRRQKQPVTCVYCRVKWPDMPAASAQAGPSRQVEGYTNFGATVGASMYRDTSSYYQGPRRGMTMKEARNYYADKYY